MAVIDDSLVRGTTSKGLVEMIRDYLGVDTLEYLTLDETLDAAGRRNEWCHACFSGDYPTPVQFSLGSLRHSSPPVTATV